MILLKKYESLEDVLKFIKLQIRDSIQYAKDSIPAFSDPAELFYWLKDRVIYKSDPVTIELIMTMETMMSGSRTGTPGAGDCDDFTITAMACLIACGFSKNRIVLTGKNSDSPVHIYVSTFYNGNWYAFDLTNENFDQERKYKFKQELDFKL